MSKDIPAQLPREIEDNCRQGRVSLLVSSAGYFDLVGAMNHSGIPRPAFGMGECIVDEAQPSERTTKDSRSPPANKNTPKLSPGGILKNPNWND
ncbi:MAG: hypothetical protein ACSHX0_12650 [Akkermansiaceae bacterium]